MSLKSTLILATLISGFQISADPLPHACNGVTMPNKPVTVILPVDVGNSSDIAARILLDGANKKFPLKFVVLNRAGASGNLGMAAARDAAKVNKNETLVFSQAPEVTINPKLSNAIYKAEDFQAVTYVSAMSYVLMCHVGEDLPLAALDSIDTFVEHVRKNNKSITFGHGGWANLTSIATTKLSEATHLKGESLRSVPYKSTSNAMRDVMGNQINCMFQSVAGADSIIKNQGPTAKVRVVGSTLGTEQKAIAKSQHAKNFKDLSNWMGFFAGKDMDAKVVKCYDHVFQEILKDAETKTKLTERGFIRSPSDPKSSEEFSAFVLKESQAMKTIAVDIDKSLKDEGASPSDSPTAPAAVKNKS